MYNKAIIIGGGHSTEILEWDDWVRLERCFTFGLNYAFKLLTPTALVFDNDRFYNENEFGLKELESYKISHHCKKRGVHYIPPSKKYWGKKSLQKRQIYTHTLTGIYTLTLAICLGFKVIYLFGYDMNMSKDNMLHNRELKHPHNSLAPYRPQISKFEVFRNLETPIIYNVNPYSALNVFPKISYGEFLLHMKIEPQNINQEEARVWLRKHLLQESQGKTGVI